MLTKAIKLNASGRLWYAQERLLGESSGNALEQKKKMPKKSKKKGKK